MKFSISESAGQKTVGDPPIPIPASATDGKFPAAGNPDAGAAAVAAAVSDVPAREVRLTPGKRRLRDIPRDKQRPLESQLQSLRRAGRRSAAEISSILDLHPDDLDALSAIGGRF
ncbi:MAG: hypothetical protein EOP86_13150 [Verrucomicrobiaceae bacterium]|nr:MAG: hypothetical protein EOP86_13150 [Verrucomicrobiaceae bacterium]